MQAIALMSDISHKGLCSFLFQTCLNSKMSEKELRLLLLFVNVVMWVFFPYTYSYFVMIPNTFLLIRQHSMILRDTIALG